MSQLVHERGNKIVNRPQSLMEKTEAQGYQKFGKYNPTWVKIPYS